MSVIQIREARREGARLVIGIAGISGSGKTYTAIQLAHGLANYDASKIGVLDTENRRGSLYADSLRDREGRIARFMIGDLYAPFSPQRYIDAIHEFQKAGVEVLVIDSVTHEWEGLGGCAEIAETGNPKIPNWKLAKREHNRFMHVLLASNMHIIACIRAREKVEIRDVVKDGKKTKDFVSLGVLPVQEKNFMFEMTASILMWDSGKSQQVLKCPAELMPILGRQNGYITAEDGHAIRRWVDGAEQLDPTVEKWRNALQSATEKGFEHIKSCWSQTKPNIQAALGEAFRSQLFAAAEAFDTARARAATDVDDEADDINQALGLSSAADSEEEYPDE